MRHLVLSLLSAAALVACTEAPTSPRPLTQSLPLPEGTSLPGQFIRQVGLGWVEGNTLAVSVPTQVQRGAPLTVRVAVTLGGCTGSDTTVAVVSGQTATIVPYSAEPSPAALPLINCIAGVFRDERRPTVVFNQAGDALVRVIVRGGPKNDLQVVERRVMVLP